MLATFEENDALVKSYQTAQCDFIREKTSALKVIERKMELESSLQDHKQVRMYHLHKCDKFVVNPPSVCLSFVYIFKDFPCQTLCYKLLQYNNMSL